MQKGNATSFQFGSECLHEQGNNSGTRIFSDFAVFFLSPLLRQVAGDKAQAASYYEDVWSR